MLLYVALHKVFMIAVFESILRVTKQKTDKTGKKHIVSFRERAEGMRVTL